MSTTKRNTYRGKYPNRIVSVWGTTTKGVYACETNSKQRFFFTTREMIAADYKVSASQILKMDCAALDFLTTSIADAAMRVEQPKPARKNLNTPASGMRVGDQNGAWVLREIRVTPGEVFCKWENTKTGVKYEDKYHNADPVIIQR